MTIKFIFTQDACYVDEQDATYLEVQTDKQHLEGVLESFRTFLLHLGHHPDNIDRVQFVEGPERSGLPQQLELFPDETDEASGV